MNFNLCWSFLMMVAPPLHVVAKNPLAPADIIAELLELKMEAAFCLDNEAGMSPLARQTMTKNAVF